VAGETRRMAGHTRQSQPVGSEEDLDFPDK
jgi:hypothetical protein